MDQMIDLAEALVEGVEEAGDLTLVGYIAGSDECVFREAFCKLPHTPLHALVLVIQSDRGAFICEGLDDSPSDRALVRDAEDHRHFSIEGSHAITITTGAVSSLQNSGQGGFHSLAARKRDAF